MVIQQLMISAQKQSQSRKLGFSFIEVIISVTIIGILTAITIPNYTHYLDKNNNLLVEQEALILQEEMFARMVYLAETTSVNIPYVSSSNHGGPGVIDISDNSMLTIFNQLILTSSIVDYDEKETLEVINTTALSYPAWEVECLMTFESGQKINLFFEVKDDKVKYHDICYLTKFIYTNSDGISVEKTLVL